MSCPAPLRSVAAHGLGTRALAPSTPLPAEAWTALIEAAVAHRLTGLLVASIGDGTFAATDAQYDAAVSAQVDAMHVALLLESALIDVDGRLAGAGVEYRVLKGPAYAHLLYPDPSLRPFGDIDLLVRGEDFARAASLVEALGATRPASELSRGFDRRFGKGAMFVLPTGFEIDLHRTFVFGPFGFRMVPEDLFATSEQFVIGGRTLPALGAEGRFLHACYHAALGSPAPRLLVLRDVAQALLTVRLDIVAVEHLSTRWRGQAVLATAICLAWDTLEISDVVPLSVWARHYQVDRRDQRALDVYRSRASYLVQAAASISSIPGLRSKAAFVASLATSRAARHPVRSGRRRRVADAARVMLPGVPR